MPKTIKEHKEYKTKFTNPMACLNRQGVAESSTNDTVCLLGYVIKHLLKMERRYFNIVMTRLS